MSGSDKRLSLAQECICGTVSGSLSRTVTAPLDVGKVLYQVGTPLATHTRIHGGLIGLWKTLYKVEGWKSLFKGNWMACVKIFPYEIIRYLSYHQIKSQLTDKYGRLTPTNALITGAAAGVLATVCTYPMETLKTRIIVQPYDKKISSYKSYLHAVALIRSEEGSVALFRGLSPTLLATVPSGMSLIFTYEMISRHWYRPYLQQTATDALLQGILASFVSLCVSHPFDTIRRKMQAHSRVLPNRGGVDIDFNGAIDCYMKTVQHLRRQGLWHGFLPALIRIAPFNATMFYVYESCKRSCIVYNGFRHRAAESHYGEEDIDDADYFDEEIYKENLPLELDDESD